LIEEFFNLSEEIVQRSESKRSKNAVHMQPKQNTVDRPIDRHAQMMHSSSSIDRLVDRRKERSTNWHKPCFCWGPINRRKGRSTERSIDWQIC